MTKKLVKPKIDITVDFCNKFTIKTATKEKMLKLLEQVMADEWDLAMEELSGQARGELRQKLDLLYKRLQDDEADPKARKLVCKALLRENKGYLMYYQAATLYDELTREASFGVEPAEGTPPTETNDPLRAFVVDVPSGTPTYEEIENSIMDNYEDLAQTVFEVLKVGKPAIASVLPTTEGYRVLLIAKDKSQAQEFLQRFGKWRAR